MIRAVKTQKENPKAQQEYEQLKAFYQVQPTIDVLQV